MRERDYGYVAATFSGKDIEPFQKLTGEICAKKDLYHSETVNYTNGDVSSNLHFNIFYGLIDEQIDKEKLQAHIDQLQLDKLRLGELFLRQTPDNKYQILWVMVADDEDKLKEITESFKAFKHDESVQLEFMPHLTLAYVRPKYRLGDLTLNYPKEIKVEKIQYFEK